MKITAAEFQNKIKSGEIQSTKNGLVSNFDNSKISENKKVKNASKVDINLNPITEKIPEWRKKHPGEIYFDSVLEGQFYWYLKNNNIKFTLKPKVKVIDKFKYHNSTERTVVWNPDFAINTKPIPIIIDTKGYPNDAFPLKLKMVKYILNLRYGKNTPHIWFIKNKKQFIIALNAIKRIQKGKKLDGIEKQLLFKNQK